MLHYVMYKMTSLQLAERKKQVLKAGELNKLGVPIAVIARKLKVSRNTIYAWLKIYDVSKRYLIP